MSARLPVALRVVAGVFALLLLVSAVVQLNDPDPVGWFLVYFSGALLSLAVVVGRNPWRLCAGLALVTTVWAATLAPGVVGTPGFPRFGLDGAGMLEPHVEETREMFGLLLEAAMLGAMALVGGRRRAP